MPQFEQNRILEAVSQENWEHAAAELQQLDPAEVAELLQKLPFEQQQNLFGHLPVEFAAKVVGEFPYYHQYVLLHSRGPEAMRAIVDKLDPDDRMRFFDELPEEAWQHLMDELSAVDGTARSETSEVPPTLAEEASRLRETIIDACQVEKTFEQSDGNEIQVIAPLDLAIESNTICALLGPSGSGKSTLLRILSGLSQPSRGTIDWPGAAANGSNHSVGIVFQSFAL